MGRIFTTNDIQLLLREGQTTLLLREGDSLTDLAREMVRQKRICVTAADGMTPAVATKSPTAFPGAAPAQRGDTYDLVVHNGVCVIPEVGCAELNVCIRDGKIAAITTERLRGRQEIDASGLYVLPGIIDPHTHLGLFVPLEEELVSETRAALLGGVTTIGTYFNQQGSYLPLLEKLEAEVPTLSRVDIIPHLALREEAQVQEMPLYSARGMNSFKVYMCGVPGLYPHQEDGFILHVMERMRALKPKAEPILSIHCENTSICDFATEEMRDLSLETLGDWNSTHPNIAEGEAVLRAAYLSKKAGARTYVVHNSTKEAMEALRKIKHENLIVETTSPYLCLDTESDIGAYGKMLPPIREPESRDALWDGIRDGIIDTIGTDNTVMTSGEKRVSAGMRQAGAGYPTLGAHLASVLNEGVFHRGMPIEKLVPLMTVRPAKAFGVYPRKGTILPGSDADLVLVDMNSARAVEPEALLGRSDFSLFQGKTLRGWPAATIKGGRIVAWNGKLVDDEPRGRVLRH